VIAVLSGTVASLAFMFNAGRDQKSVLLIILFTGWVVSPFMALLAADVKSKRWFIHRVTLFFLMFLITLLSLIFYSGVLSVPGTKNAFNFLIVPLVSWLLIVIFIAAPALRSRRISRKKIR